MLSGIFPAGVSAKNASPVQANAEFAAEEAGSATVTDAYGKPISAVIADGYALYDEEDNLVDSSVNVLPMDNAVHIDSHSHSFDDDGKCACGYTCGHSDIETDSNGNTVCRECGTKFTVKIEKDGVTAYGTDINDALANAEDGSKITVIAIGQTSLRQGVYMPNDAAVTLDLNGKALDGHPLNVGGSSCRNSKLTVIDSNSGGNGTIGLIVRDNGTLLFAPNNGTTLLSRIEAYGGNIELRGGCIRANEWTFGDGVNLTSLLAPGYAYRDYTYGWNGDWVRLSALTGKNVTRNFNLSVQKCPHPGTEEICEYCGAHTSVKVTKDGADSFYVGLSDDAIAAANGGVITLLENVTTTDGFSIENNNLTFDLNGKKLTHDSSGKLFDLGGGAHLTVVDSSAAALGEIYSEGYIFNTSGNATLDVKGGRFSNFKIKDAAPATVLADGYAFANIADGSLVDGYAVGEDGDTTLLNVMVVSHTSHSYEASTGKCGCGFACTHESVDSSSWSCNACGKQAKAKVTDWDDKNPRWCFDVKETVASAGTGEYIKVLLRSGVHTFTENIPVYGNVNIFILGGSADDFIAFDGDHSFVAESGGVLLVRAYTHIERVTVKAGGVFGEEETSTVDHLILEENCKLFTDSRLQSGNFGKITVPEGHRVGDTVMKSGDTERSFKHIGGTWATEEELRSTEITNVSVQPLPFSHPSIAMDLKGVAKWETNDKIEQIYGAYNGKNLLELSVTKTKGNITAYKWVIDYYAPGSESVTDTETLTEESIGEYYLKKVGTYKVRCTVTADGYSKELTGKDIVIAKATAGCTAPTANDLTYNGREQALVTEGRAFGGTMYYSLDGEAWSENVPNASEAKTYTVYYKVIGGANYNDSPVESLNVTIKPFAFDGISAIIEKYYDETANLPDTVPLSFKGTVGTSRFLDEGTEYCITGGKYASSNPGTDIDVTLKIKLINTNYAFKDGEGTTFEKEFTLKGTINKATDAPIPELGTLTIIKKLDKTYTFDVSALLNEPRYGYGNIKYKIDVVDLDSYYSGGATIDEESGLLTVPIQSFNIAGSDVAGIIYLTAVTDNYTDIQLTVSVMAKYQIVPTGEPTFSKKELTYGDELGKIVLSGSLTGENGESVTGTFSWEDPTVKPSAGTYNAHWRFTPDENFFMYTATGGYVDIAVLLADPVCDAPVKKEGLIYNGDEQALVTEGTAYGGTMYYSLDGTTWLNTVPTAKNADSYTVYYKVKGDENHKDSTQQTIDASIAQLPVIIRWNNTAGLVYDGNVKTVGAEVTNTKNADVVTVTLGDTFTARDKGDYVASVTAVDNPNYTVTGGTNTTVNWSIARAYNSIENLAITGWTYGEPANAPSADAKFGDVVYRYASEKNGNYGLTVPGDAGTHWVKASVEGCENYAGAESEPISFAIAKKNIAGAAVGEFNLRYSGSEQTPSATVTTVDGFTVTGEWSKVTNVNDRTTFTASGNFEGTIADVDTEMEALSVDSAEITLGAALTYNGNDQAQSVSSVKVGDLTLGENDYTVSGDSGKPAGEYTLTITGKGNFTGAKNCSWSIAKAKPSVNSEKETTARLRKGRKLADASVKNGEMLGIDNAVLEGTFDWVDGTKTLRADSTEQMLFKPNDANYSDLLFDVKVNVYASSGGGGSSSSSTKDTVYTVKFETAGGTKIENQSVKKNGTVTEPEAPEKEGFKFSGWYTDEERKAEYAFSTKVTEDLTLYAAWAEIEKETSEPGTENPFDDVKKDDWFYDDVINAVKKGLFNGTGSRSFDPNMPITRGMLVTILYRSEGEPKASGNIPFADVAQDSYYANAVIWAKENGIVSGISETEFAPDVNITREQLAAIMFRFAKYKGTAPTGAWAIRLNYTDLESISDYAAEAVMYCTLKGIMQGRENNRFAPQENAVRAEAAAILLRFIGENQ